MKLFSKIQDRQPGAKASVAGVTLSEMMIAIAIFSLIVICMVSSQLFALRTYSIAKAKMVTSAGARKAEDKLRDAIRSADAISIGNYKNYTNITSSSFLSVTNGSIQGNALEIFTTTNSTPYLICRLNVPKEQLEFYDSSTANLQVLVGNIINTNIFAAEDFRGSVLSGNPDNYTIRMKLIFNQDVYSTHSGDVNDHYQFTMRATVR